MYLRPSTDLYAQAMLTPRYQSTTKLEPGAPKREPKTRRNDLVVAEPPEKFGARKRQVEPSKVVGDPWLRVVSEIRSRHEPPTKNKLDDASDPNWRPPTGLFSDLD